MLNYDEIHEKWKNRNRILQIPFDYRFPEQFPLIKKEDYYYVTNFLLLTRSIIWKPYHILSEETKNQKPSFRNFFTKNIAEPILKEKLKVIFECNTVKGIKVVSENNEFADFGLVSGDNIFLFEIKSVYMGLEIRYTIDEKKFKNEFDKRYILNDSGEHQQINQLLKIENNYDKFIDLTKLDKNIQYKIFCVELAFDEVLKCIRFNPFNLYVKDEFRKRIEVERFENIKPYPFNILITFNELITLREVFINPEKRILILKTFFRQEFTSLEFLISDLESGEISIEGINKKDFRVI